MRRWIAGLLASGVVACANPDDGPWLVEGSTYRIGAPVQREEPTLHMEVFLDREACLADADVAEAEVDDCVPIVDRAHGDVRLAFALRDAATGDPRELALDGEAIRASHDRQGVREQEVIPHTPIRASQLFIILVDGSGSMFQGEEGSRIVDRVYRALLRRKVREAFFPGDGAAETGVVLLRFTDRLTGLDGRAPHIVTDPRRYEEEVRRNLFHSPRGYTHLYDAVGSAITDVLEVPEIADWLTLRKSAEPTIIVLTDGFNNEDGADRCGDNAGRLAGLLERIRQAQVDGTRAQRQARIYTVGLGRGVFRDFDVDRVKTQRPSPETLCMGQEGRTINADLERYGIDNASLEWIAAVGKGESYIATDDGRLAQVFLDAAAMRYAWYEVRYRVDPWYHRRSFEVGIEVIGEGAGVRTTVYPSGWIDAPPPERVPGTRWTAPVPLRASLGLVMPILGGLVLIHFLGPAGFNGRRAITRRARRTKRAPPPQETPPAT